MKTEKRFRVLSLILASVLVFLCSCAEISNKDTDITDTGAEESQNTQSDQDNNGTVQNGPADYFSAIPQEDFGGYEFVILTTDPDFCDSDTDSGFLGSAIYRRNRAIEEKFNIKLTAVPCEDASLQSMVVSADSEKQYDLIYAPMNTIASCAGNGLVMNIHSVPFFDTSAEYVQPELVDSLSVCDTSYGVYGAGAHDMRSQWCVYYNKYLMSGIGYNIPELVKNGEWTWEKFAEISALAVADINNDGRMRASADRYGYASTDYTGAFANAVFASVGKKYLARDDEGFYKMDFAETEEDKYISFLRDICVNNKARYPSNDGAKAFSEGRAAFFCEKLSYASHLAYSGCDWGIAPMPKRNPQQSGYLNLSDPSVCGYAVPYGATDSALAGKVLSAIYAYEYSYGNDTVPTAWTHYYLRDNASAVMLKKYFRSPVYDAAYAFGEGFADFRLSTYEFMRSVLEKNVNFAHLYNQNSAPFSAFMRTQFVH